MSVTIPDTTKQPLGDAVDIAGWLESLGLERYASAFAENAVEWDVLPKLTSEDLSEIGVTTVGDRRRLLDAISRLCLADAATTPAPSTTPAHAVERRYLTVMFCDLVGSTALSTRFDPEDLREMIGAYHGSVAANVGRFAGFVAKYMGDGVLVYFGYPIAHEDDAERAVRAGLAVIDAVRRLDLAEPLRARLGVASGLVVVGDLIGEGAAQERGVVGETLNLAARLQAVAPPNSIVIADGTRRQLGALFDFEDLGAQTLAGFAEPQSAWRVVGEGQVVSRFEALRSGLTQLVGRDEEIEQLIRRWTQAKGGSGKVVLICAEPGVGKSRLAEALASRIAAELPRRQRYFCSPHHQDSAFYPVIAQMERAAGFAHGDELPTKLVKLQALLAGTTPSLEDVGLIAELHGLPKSDLLAVPDLTPQRKRERIFEALLRQVEGLSQQQPILMMFDDLHWIDSSSGELLDRLIERITAWPVLLLATFRPEFQPPWVGQPHVTLLTLPRLDQRHTMAMIASVVTIAGDRPLSSEIVEEIAERSDGVPLFVEELTKTVLEARTQAPAALDVAPRPGLSVPATLHASLIARLDRLGPAAREVAQTAAAIGREFGFALLASVTTLPASQLREALNRLSDASLVFARGTPPDASYLFKHALVQDVAYGTLLRSRCQRLHRRIAVTLEKQFPEIVHAQPALLAHHCMKAALTEQAIAYLHQAAKQSVARSAMAEAVVQLGQALEMLAGLPVDPTRHRQELELQTTLGVPLLAIRGMASPEVGQAYTRAKELCLELGDTSHLASVLFGLWWFYEVSGDLHAAYEVAGQLLDMVRTWADSGPLVQAHRAMGQTLLWLGEFVPALEHFEEAMALYDPQQHRSLTLTDAQEPGVLSRGFAAHVLWYLGYPDRALEIMSESLARAKEVGHPFSLAFALDHAAWLHHYRRETAETLEWAEEDIKFSGEQGFPFFLAQGSILRGWALTEQGLFDEGISQISRGLAAREATGALLVQPYWMSLLAQAHLRGGQVEHGQRILHRALAAVSGQNVWKAELHRLQGEFLLARPRACDHADTDQSITRAEDCFRRAIQTARLQQSKSLELRAGTSLARLWTSQGNRKEARDLVGPIYNWFTEGFDTQDLKEAKALLDELA